eukprot:CAMPEP_0202964580 /NCGR_PEP_ID=MMETSP1396-20130829/8659_1 /ASSEMBLY_ACC=CAM_ASM_000872 /TAXON_ID= /ORGANISM="Pseudokeronopsis sp., Strain Brazil" /LENGTH=188 /DNA_ID=CAMNT_0049686789 /DNA_START=51 /DNA_END=617 /DNA_ORIENTATION=-
MRYFVIEPSKGLITKYERKEDIDKIASEMKKQGLKEMNWKLRAKFKVELIYLSEVMAVYPCFRVDFIKKNQHCLELTFFNDSVIYLAAYDNDRLQEWQSNLMKAKKFSDWFSHLQGILGRTSELTEQIKTKLKEIVEFCLAFGEEQVKEIEFIEYTQAIHHANKPNLIQEQSQPKVKVQESIEEEAKN